MPIRRRCRDRPPVAGSGLTAPSVIAAAAILCVVGLEPGTESDLIDRASAIDMMELASDFGPLPLQVGAILVFGSGESLAAGEVRDALAGRVCAIPRLRQQLVSTPPGCGRPVWADDPEFDVARHVHEIACSRPGDQDALLRAAAAVMAVPLPAGQPLWSATIVTGLAGEACALIVVFHHVLADGMGGLAVLASLADGAASAPQQNFPRPKPTARRLAVDAAVSRVRVLAHLGRVPAGVRDALAELRPGATPRAPRCSLNRPVGVRRRLGAVRADLAQVRSAGRAVGGTVNDVVLAAVSGALRTQMAGRGERIDQIVVSVPVSGRAEASPARLGNQVGVTPVMIPAAGAPLDRLAAIAEITRRHKSRTRGASAALIAPAFRLLAALGMLRWLAERQHLVTCFVTNLRGPDVPVSFLGAAVCQMIPLVGVAGNVTVAFAVLSYAGTLTVAVMVDADACPDSGTLIAALQRELDALTTPNRT